MRNLKAGPPCTDLFGRAGRRWLEQLQLPIDERQTVNGSLRQLDFLGEELALVEQTIAEQALASPEIRRLMTIPGVDVTTAVTLLAAIADIGRFRSPGQLVGYLGLHPRLRQSGSAPGRHGRTSKEGSAAARHVLVEAAWSAAKAPGPLGHSRSRQRRAADATSPPSPSPASSACSPGTCSLARTITPSSVPRSSVASCAGLS